MPTESFYHEPVLAQTAVDLLVTDPSGRYADCTLGGGGHSRLILEKLASPALLLGCDRDPDALEHSRLVLPPEVALVRSRFSDLSRSLKPLLAGGLSGALFDLGVSSYQIDTAERGFSHRFSGPLDLRMDRSSGETAADLLARLDLSALTRLIGELGEDNQARRIANAIIREREHRPVRTTEDLAGIIERAVPATRNKSLARVFQALRIAVNNELGEIEQGLAAAWDLLKPGGRLVVISYHSLEDRIVKNFMKRLSHPQSDVLLPFPSESDVPQALLLNRKPILPDVTEIERNPRARSAKLRAVEKKIL